MALCKNCGHRIRINPFSSDAEWLHSEEFKKNGKDRISYCITCKCGCIKPQPTNKAAKENEV